MMRKVGFQTVGVDLLSVAKSLIGFYKLRTYQVSLEPRVVGYPNTPTLTAKRSQTLLIVELDRAASVPKLKNWVQYAKSCNSDVRIVTALVDIPDAVTSQLLRSEGIGLISCVNGQIIEEFLPRDLSVNLQLPNYEQLHKKLRAAFATMYEKHQNSYWRECFDEACKVIEKEAKGYLLNNVLQRTSVLNNKGQPRPLTRALVNRLTLGQLAVGFSMIQAPTQNDSYIGETLSLIFRDRNKWIHAGHSAATERVLRRNVGSHIWRIIGALKIIYGI
ncbi:MAG: hypothetical protein ACYDCJ_06585 [Gammaproteobacteria bacterium]